MLALLAAIFLFILIDRTLWKWLRGCWKCCCQDVDEKLKTAPENTFKSYEEEYKKMSAKMVASYDIVKNSKYTEIINAMDEEFDHVEKNK